MCDWVSYGPLAASEDKQSLMDWHKKKDGGYLIDLIEFPNDDRESYCRRTGQDYYRRGGHCTLEYLDLI